MTTKPIKVVAVGAGYFSQFQYQGWKNMADVGVSITALANRDQSKAQAMAQRFGISKTYDNVAQMLDEEKPDLLDIITTPPTFREYIQAAAERKVAVICQKPWGRDYAEAVALTDLAEQAGIPLAVHENFRWQRWYREAKRLIDAGELGQLHSVAFRMRPGDGQGVDAYLDRQPYFQTMPRLLVYETAIHWIDTFRYLMGEVSAVYARLRKVNPVIRGEDAGYIVFEFESGATGLYDGNRLNDHVASNPRRTMGEMWLEGSRGVLRLDGEGQLWWKAHRGEERRHEFDRGDLNSFGGGACEWLQRHMVRHLQEGTALENTGRDCLKNLKVQEAVYRSHRDGVRIALDNFNPVSDPITETFPS